MQVAVDLDAADLDALREIAANDRLTLEDVVTLAVRNYVARRRTDDEEGKRRWDEVITQFRSGVPADVTPEEIEADIAVALAEVRQERRARGHCYEHLGVCANQCCRLAGADFAGIARQTLPGGDE